MNYWYYMNPRYRKRDTREDNFADNFENAAFGLLDIEIWRNTIFYRYKDILWLYCYANKAKCEIYFQSGNLENITKIVHHINLYTIIMYNDYTYRNNE